MIFDTPTKYRRKKNPQNKYPKTKYQKKNNCRQNILNN